MGSWGCFPGAVLERDPVSFYNVVSDFHLGARLGKIHLEARFLCDGFPGCRKHKKAECERTHHS